MAKDVIHEAVKSALIKDGWIITHDPYTIEYEEIRMSADLGAERPFAAERQGEKIVVEIKSFLGRSPLQDLKVALGQYNLYKAYLEIVAPERKLYLAIDGQIYKDFFNLKAIKLIVQRYEINLIVVDVLVEEVLKWIS